MKKRRITLTKHIDTLILDIQILLNNAAQGWAVPIKKKDISQLSKDLTGHITDRFSPKTRTRPAKTLYASEVGKQCQRQLWYKYHDYPGERMAPNDLLRLLYGDLLEDLVLFLARSAGHRVEDEQKVIEIPLKDGWVLRGRLDARIDGYLTDVKTASSYAFKKFKEESIEHDDPFGYLSQLSLYAEHEGQDEAGFLVLNKENGVLLLHTVDGDLLEASRPDFDSIIDTLSDEHTEPERAFLDKDDGAYGNKVLVTECSFCPFKQYCWRDANDGHGLRVFKYANGFTKYYTHIDKMPRIEELSLPLTK